MITSKDLCIGNVVWLYSTTDDTNKPYIIHWSDFELFDIEDILYNPIPINPKILDHLGFEKFTKHGHYFYQCGFMRIVYETFKNGLFYDIWHNDLGREIKYFHELENLYYFTTGQHMEIDLDLLEYDKIKKLL